MQPLELSDARVTWIKKGRTDLLKPLGRWDEMDKGTMLLEDLKLGQLRITGRQQEITLWGSWKSLWSFVRVYKEREGSIGPLPLQMSQRPVCSVNGNLYHYPQPEQDLTWEIIAQVCPNLQTRTKTWLKHRLDRMWFLLRIKLQFTKLQFFIQSLKEDLEYNQNILLSISLNYQTVSF